MENLFARMTDITMKEDLMWIMDDYVGNLSDEGVKEEVIEKFYNNSTFTFSGMTKEQAYTFHNRLMDMYDTLMVSSEYFETI